MSATIRSDRPACESATPPVVFRVRGDVLELSPVDRRALFDRSTGSDESVRAAVRDIVDRVRREGDAALVALARQFEGVELTALEVTRAACDAALAELDGPARAALVRAARNIRSAHAAWMPVGGEVETEPGVRVERRPDPLDRVGVYAPGGRASYPSSVLMGAIPARVAGVREVVLCTPPGPHGTPSRVILAAAAVADVDRVFAIGGAGAIAAMAFGTGSVPRVDRIVGPGNAYVAEAKSQVAGVVATDAPAGPSELLVLADATTDADFVAAEVVAQAEHDPRASVVIVVVGERTGSYPEHLAAVIASRADAAARRAIVLQALAERGALLTARSLDAAVAFANAWAPEHLLIAVESPEALVSRIRGAGTIAVGPTSSVVFGDYMTGANHVLPTGGLARSYGGLSTLDFVRWTTIQRVSRSAASAMADDVALLAEAEQLPAHAAAARGAAHAAVRTGFRAAYGRIGRYVGAGVPGSPVELSDNTNLWGAPPSAARAIEDTGARVSRYPAAYADALVAALADYAGVSVDMVVTGCGSDDVLDAAMRALGEPGDRVALPDPTFPMAATIARMNGLVPVAVPLTAEHTVDVDALAAVGARLIYLATPSNPTGIACAPDTLRRLTGRAPGFVIVDEAYAEFTGRDRGCALDLVATSPRLLVVRTLSKAWGLAGLRIGYAVGQPALVAEVEKARGPYKVSVVAEQAALAALAHDRAWMARCVAAAADGRARLATALSDLGLRTLPSHANFLLVPIEGPTGSARRFASALRALGVGVRAYDALTGIGDAIRVTVGPWPMMERLLEAVATVLAAGDAVVGSADAARSPASRRPPDTPSCEFPRAGAVQP